MLKLRTLCSSSMVIIALATRAQLAVDPSPSTQELVQGIFQGSGVTISNVTFNGSATTPLNGSTAYYNYEGGLDIPEEGIILATGLAIAAAGPASGFASMPLSSGSDPDLEILIGEPIYDATVIEFDFIPDEDQMMFEYVFASEEYPQYVCTYYNDVFGFFLSGPGISGPFSGNAANIALIPDTQIPVSINTINGGVADFGDSSVCASIDPNWQANSVYYLDNSNGPDVVYNGMTTVLPISVLLIPGETYHIKLAVGDGSDTSFDSAIFLEAASFRSVPSLTTQLARLHESLRLNAWFDGQGQLVMETGEITIGAVRLLDLNGRLVHQMLTNGSGRIEMPEPHVPAGVYLLEAESEGRVLRAKLVKA